MTDDEARRLRLTAATAATLSALAIIAAEDKGAAADAELLEITAVLRDRLTLMLESGGDGDDDGLTFLDG